MEHTPPMTLGLLKDILKEHEDLNVSDDDTIEFNLFDSEEGQLRSRDIEFEGIHRWEFEGKTGIVIDFQIYLMEEDI
jgi:hypothetical protein